jgi:DNA-binding NarL/FixJ family response regulator
MTLFRFIGGKWNIAIVKENIQNTRPVLETKKVLLIDPSQIFAQMLKNVIKTQLPYVEVIHAESPDKADRLMETNPPNVIFLDICILPKNGVRYIRSIKRRIPQSRLIVLTTHDSNEHKTAALKKGADCFISKNHASGKHIVDFVEAALI